MKRSSLYPIEMLKLVVGVGGTLQLAEGKSTQPGDSVKITKTFITVFQWILEKTMGLMIIFYKN